MPETFRERVLARARLTGTFVKTPSHEIIEVLAMSGLDFLCLDAEHAPFDRARMDRCRAIGRALGIPMLGRVQAGRPELMLAALDSGATGLVIPHVDSVPKAEDVARAARFGPGGRGYAGSTRWARFGTGQMPALLERSARETVVLAQIEEPEGVEASDGIAAVAGIDGLFVGPADLSVGYGKTDQSSDALAAAYRRVQAACDTAQKPLVTWAPNAEKALDVAQRYGVTMTFIGSDHSWMLAGARAVAATLRDA